MFPSRRGANALNELARLSRRQMVPNKDRTEPGTGPHEMHYKDSYHLVPQIRAVVVIFFNYRDMSVRIHHPITRLSFPFSALPLWLHLGGSSTPSPSSLLPSSFVLCTVVTLHSARLRTVYRRRGGGHMLTNWCCVPAGIMMRSSALRP